MTTRENGAARARTYQPLNALAYLRTRGWNKVSESPERYSVWTRADAEQEYEVLVPLALSAPDLGRRVQELVETLGVQEDRPADEIWEDLSSPYSDIIRLRLPGAGDDPTLPLEDGSAAFQHTRDLMLAAACAAWRPKGLYGPRKPDEALEVVRCSRLAPARPGSYVIKVITPLAAGARGAEPGSLFDADDEPESFARRATTCLTVALQAALEAAREAATAGQVDAAGARIAQGLSANFCVALAGLCRIGNGLDVHVAWAPALEQRQEVRSRIRVPGDAVVHLEQMARRLRQTTELEDAEFRGVVYRHTAKDEDTDEVVLNGDLDGTARSLRVLVDGDVRQALLQAFNERRVVTCVGEVLKKGKFHWMRNVRDLQVLPTDGDEDEAGA